MFKFINSVALASLASAVEKLSSLIFVPVLARALSPSEFGELNAAYNLAFFICLFVINGQTSSIFLIRSQWKEYFSYQHFEKRVLITNFIFFIAISCLLLLNILGGLSDVYLNIPSTLLFICTFACVSTYPSVVRSTVYIIEERFKENLFVSLIRLALSACVFFSLLNIDVTDVVNVRPYAEIISGSLIGSYFVLSLFKKTRIEKLTPSANVRLKKLVKDSYRYGWTLQFSQVCFWAIASSDRIILNKIIGGTATAYHAVLMVGILPMFIVSSLNNIISSKFNSLSSQGNLESANNLLLKGYVGGVSLGLLYKFSLIFLGGWIIPLYAGEQYVFLSQYLHLCGTVLIGYYLYLLSSRRLHYSMDTKYIALTSVIAAIINVIINIEFIDKYGFIVSVYSTILSYFFISILAVIKSDKDIFFKNQTKLMPTHMMCVLFVAIIEVFVYIYV